MIRELQKPAYQAAYRIFMNPFATKRQLMVVNLLGLRFEGQHMCKTVLKNFNKHNF